MVIVFSTTVARPCEVNENSGHVRVACTCGEAAALRLLSITLSVFIRSMQAVDSECFGKPQTTREMVQVIGQYPLRDTGAYRGGYIARFHAKPNKLSTAV